MTEMDSDKVIYPGSIIRPGLYKTYRRVKRAWASIQKKTFTG